MHRQLFFGGITWTYCCVHFATCKKYLYHKFFLTIHFIWYWFSQGFVVNARPKQRYGTYGRCVKGTHSRMSSIRTWVLALHAQNIKVVVPSSYLLIHGLDLLGLRTLRLTPATDWLPLRKSACNFFTGNICDVPLAHCVSVKWRMSPVGEYQSSWPLRETRGGHWVRRFLVFLMFEFIFPRDNFFHWRASGAEKIGILKPIAILQHQQENLSHLKTGSYRPALRLVPQVKKY